MKMDLLYNQPPQDFLDEAKELGIEISDASDCIHKERVEVHYADDKKEEYLALLKKHKLLEYSLNIRLN